MQLDNPNQQPSKPNWFVEIVGLIIGAVLFIPPSYGDDLSHVAVIAHSVSTSMEARRIRVQKGWAEVNYRQAEAILVVVRSMLWNPLRTCYDSIKELDDDADHQLNIIGSNFVVYLYSIKDDLSTCQLAKVDYPADE